MFLKKIFQAHFVAFNFSIEQATNKMFVGVPTNYSQATEGDNGDYLCLRNYQWNQWTNPDQSTLKAAFNVEQPKIINNFELDYYVESSSFEGDEMVVKIIMSNKSGNETVVDTFSIIKDSISKDIDIHYAKTLDEEIEIYSFSIQITTYKEGLTSDGLSTAIFFKNIVCNYLM